MTGKSKIIHIESKGEIIHIAGAPLESNAAYNVDTGTLTDSYVRAVKDVIPDNICVTDAFWRELTSIVVSDSICRQNRANRPPAVEIERWQRIAELLADEPTILYRKMAESQIAGFEALNEGFITKRNLHDITLHRWMLDLWHRGLGQPLSVSRRGPLQRFFQACTSPLIGKTLRPEGVVAIVKREKARASARAKGRKRRPAGGF